jgi:hypothetical protein
MSGQTTAALTCKLTFNSKEFAGGVVKYKGLYQILNPHEPSSNGAFTSAAAVRGAGSRDSVTE